jgi:hypothetical protein
MPVMEADSDREVEAKDSELVTVDDADDRMLEIFLCCSGFRWE